MGILDVWNQKEKIINFSWPEAWDIKELGIFVEEVAQGYILLTKTTRLRKTDLVGTCKTDFYYSTADYIKAVQKENTKYIPIESQWGHTYFETQHHFIDLEKIRLQSTAAGGSAGQALLDVCWHEWGHSDIETRTEGKLLNNKIGFYSPTSKINEPWLRYRGAEVFTQTHFGLLRFEEVLIETITVRRMVEQVGLKSYASAGDYHLNGVDFFPELTRVLKIPLESLYQLHATSDLERLAKIIGRGLPGSQRPIDKGLNLFVGIHESDKNIIDSSGALELLSK